jgi:hypothetical protein
MKAPKPRAAYKMPPLFFGEINPCSMKFRSVNPHIRASTPDFYSCLICQTQTILYQVKVSLQQKTLTGCLNPGWRKLLPDGDDSDGAPRGI